MIRGPTAVAFDSVDDLAGALKIERKDLLALARGADRMYARRRRRGRVIHAPREPLKSLQRTLQGLLRRHLEPSSILCADPLVAARSHARREWLAAVDIVNFFHSISVGLVGRSLSLLPADVRCLLVALVTRRGWLPQGAPSSPVIAEIVLYETDLQLQSEAERLGVTLSRYADDYHVTSDDRELALAMTREIVRVLGALDLNVRVGSPVPRSRPQRVLGVGVGHGPSIPRQRRRVIRSEIRAMCHRARLARRPVPEDELRRARGLIGWVRCIHPGEAERLESMLAVASV